MELGKRFDFRKVFGIKAFVILYIALFAVYIIVGLQPAEATNYEVSAELSIPSIGLASDVTSLHLEDGKLKTPETIAGSFTHGQGKTILIGHSTTVFQNLSDIKVGDVIFYDEATYQVTTINLYEKSEIDMTSLLKAEKQDTLIVMTCAGDLMENGDATHRLLVTAISVNE